MFETCFLIIYLYIYMSKYYKFVCIRMHEEERKTLRFTHGAFKNTEIAYLIFFLKMKYDNWSTAMRTFIKNVTILWSNVNRNLLLHIVRFWSENIYKKGTIKNFFGLGISIFICKTCNCRISNAKMTWFSLSLFLFGNINPTARDSHRRKKLKYIYSSSRN